MYKYVLLVIVVELGHRQTCPNNAVALTSDFPRPPAADFGCRSVLRHHPGCACRAARSRGARVSGVAQRRLVSVVDRVVADPVALEVDGSPEGVALVRAPEATAWGPPAEGLVTASRVGQPRPDSDGRSSAAGLGCGLGISTDNFLRNRWQLVSEAPPGASQHCSVVAQSSSEWTSYVAPGFPVAATRPQGQSCPIAAQPSSGGPWTLCPSLGGRSRRDPPLCPRSRLASPVRQPGEVPGGG